jgi:phage shock protein A
MGFIKPVIWMGLAGTLAAGSALAVMGPHRAHALIDTARTNFNATIDANIDDPIALRQQLRELESQYPGRIAEVRGDLAELTSQVGQLERERTISQRVVALAEADLHQMKSMLTKAETAQSGNGFALVKVRFGEESLNVEQAYSKANQINQLRGAYASKAADIDTNLTVLQQQAARLGQILAQLETERADFQSQLWQLDRQVDAIARNDRMIEMLEKRQVAFDKYDGYGNVTSPDQVQGRIAKILAEQEARLNDLSLADDQNSYERKAKNELSQQEYSFQARVGAEILNGIEDYSAIEFEPKVIEITPDSDSPATPSGPIASNN